MSAGERRGGGRRDGGRSERSQRLEALSERRTAIGEKRKELAEEVDAIDVDPQEDVVERRVDGEVRVELTPEAEARRVAAELPQKAPIDNLSPNEITVTSDGYELSSAAQRRLDEGRIEQIRTLLPEENDIYLPPEGEGGEAREVSAAISSALRTPEDVASARDVAAAAGVSVAELRDDVAAIENFDAEAAAEALPRIDDPQTIREAQQQIQERKRLIEDDPSEFAAPIVERNAGIEGFAALASQADRANQQRINRITAANRVVEERSDEIAEQVASNNELLKPSDVEVGLDAGNYAPEVSIDREAVEERQRQQFRQDAADELDVAVDDLTIEETDDGFRAVAPNKADSDRATPRVDAPETGLDALGLSEFEQQPFDDAAEVEAVDRRRESNQVTETFGRVTVSDDLEDPLGTGPEEPPTRLEQQVDGLQGPLDDASEQLRPLLRSAGGTVGETVATISPVGAVEEAATGTDSYERAVEAAGEEAALALDIPGAASGALGLAEFVAEGPDDGRTRQQVIVDEGTEAAAEFAAAAQESPAETTGRTAGALLGGFGVGTAGSRGLRQVARADLGDLSGTAGSAADDFSRFAGNTRAQRSLQLTRQRSRDADSDTSSRSVDRDSDNIPADDFRQIDQQQRSGDTVSTPDDDLRDIADRVDVEGRQTPTADLREVSGESPAVSATGDQLAVSQARADAALDRADARIATAEELVQRLDDTLPGRGRQRQRRQDTDSRQTQQQQTQQQIQQEAADQQRQIEIDADRVREIEVAADNVREAPTADRTRESTAAGAAATAADTETVADEVREIGETIDAETVTVDPTVEAEETAAISDQQQQQQQTTAAASEEAVDGVAAEATATAAEIAPIGIVDDAVEVDQQTGLETGLQVGQQAELGVETGLQVGQQTQTGLQVGQQTQTGLQVGQQTQTGLQVGLETGLQTGLQTQQALETTANQATRVRPPELPDQSDRGGQQQGQQSLQLLDGPRNDESGLISADWFTETVQARALGAFGQREVASSAAGSPLGLGLGLPTETVADPTATEREQLDLAASQFGLDLFGSADSGSQEVFQI